MGIIWEIRAKMGVFSHPWQLFYTRRNQDLVGRSDRRTPQHLAPTPPDWTGARWTSNIISMALLSDIALSNPIRTNFAAYSDDSV